MVEALARLEPYSLNTSVRFTLIDFTVLEFTADWEAAASEASGDAFLDRSAFRQNAALLMTAAEIAKRGFPLELGMAFFDFTNGDLDFVKSNAIEAALALLIDRRLLQAAERAMPIVRLTSEGQGALKVLRSRMQALDPMLANLATNYRSVFDLLHPRPVVRSQRTVRGLVKQQVNLMIGETADEMREGLISLGQDLARSKSTPRAYRFDKKYYRHASRADAVAMRSKPKTSSRRDDGLV